MRVVLFVPCEKSIIDKSDNSLSLMSILQDVTVGVHDEISADAKIPKSWQVVTIWLAEGDDQGKWFKQRVTLTNPLGKEIVNVETEFEMSKPFHRTVGRIGFLPIGVAGRWTLGVSLHDAETDRWSEPTTYPLLMLHRARNASKQHA